MTNKKMIMKIETGEPSTSEPTRKTTGLTEQDGLSVPALRMTSYS
jgi:hypothetical protein